MDALRMVLLAVSALLLLGVLGAGLVVLVGTRARPERLGRRDPLATRDVRDDRGRRWVHRPVPARAGAVLSILVPLLLLTSGGFVLAARLETPRPVEDTPRHRVVITGKEAPRRGTVCDVSFVPAPGETLPAGTRESLVRCQDLPAEGTTVFLLDYGTTTHLAPTEAEVERAARDLDRGSRALGAVLGVALVAAGLVGLVRRVRRRSGRDRAGVRPVRR